MTTGDGTASAARWAYADALADDNAADFHVAPEDRVGPPPRKRRGKRIAATLLALSAVGGGAWAYLDAPSLRTASCTVAEWSNAIAAMLGSPPATTRQAATTSPSVTAPILSPDSPAPIAAAGPPPSPLPSPSPPPQAEAPPPAAPDVVTTVPPAATPYVDAPAYVPPPPAREPWQKRAVAAGLHPELSRVLLEKLTPVDFKNARKAVDNALAARATDTATVWPRETMAGRARFEVHFVAGASEGCRRYVVTIAKDGWLTTALPVESCGAGRATAPG